MDISEFARNNSVSVKTVKRRLDEIRGWVNGENGIVFPPGTRYPMKKSLKTKDAIDRFYAILKATSQYRYVDHTYLGIGKESFEFMLRQLEEKSLIKENGTKNPYGANKYDLTLEGAQLCSERRSNAIKELSAVLGVFVGNVINSVSKETLIKSDKALAKSLPIVYNRCST